ncbi:hypothetical protein QBZ16_003268 [Prototheca wickerhamii]|uniref:HIG1 domain-containing protein n=1 Tax=Prototheca wickerhamii TaxID=3111 RepID=A0AAD9IHM3_PROWI|nr:hypothetical protein QBZ16_003268 [Prototheca wickerhamii]
MAEVHQKTTFEEGLSWVLKNKLKAVAYTWGGCVATSLAYQWTRPIPTSLKIIHTRVYAQAITLGALAAVATIETYSRSRGFAPEDDEE